VQPCAPSLDCEAETMIISNCPKEHILAAAASVGIAVTYCEAKSSTGLRHLVKLKPSHVKGIKVEAGERIYFRASFPMRAKLLEVFNALGFGLTPADFLEHLHEARLHSVQAYDAPEPTVLQGEKLANLVLGTKRPRFKRIATYQRRSTHNQDRACAALCWHGFRDFYMALFELQPEAHTHSALATYRGKESFYLTYEATASRNIGSQLHPMSIVDACWCED